MPEKALTVLTDEELALNTQGGDLSSFDEIVRRHETSIYRFIVSKTNNPTDAEDLTQQVFVRAYQKIHLYQCRYRFTPWLFTIARRQCIQHYRQKKNPETELKESDRFAIDERLPSDHLEQSDACMAIWETIRKILPEVSATAFWLRYEQDLSLKEVAKTLNLTQVHVRVILHRARLKIAKHLTETDQTQRQLIPESETKPSLSPHVKTI